MSPRRFASALVLLAACTASENVPEGITIDTTPQPEAAGPAAEVALVARADGFATPESAIHDLVQDVWFVTNINGNPGAKDNNGFISRVGVDGTVDSLRWIEGGRNGVTLHAPKGTALVGDTLWVADIDAVRGFDSRSGAPLATVEFGDRAAFLNDVAAGPDGALYVTDTGIRFDAEGNMAPAGTDQVFRLGADRSVTTALKSSALPAPNGIAWDNGGSRFVIVSVQAPGLFQWRPGTGEPERLGAAGGRNDGVLVLHENVVLLTSWADSSLIAWENGQARRLLGGIASPADIGIDPNRNRIAIPLFTENRVEFYTLPRRWWR